MKVSIDWLKDYVSVAAKPEALADRLTMSGLEAHVLEAASPDGLPVLETEVTSNRPDLLSHVGVAQEVAALFGKKVKRPEFRSLKRLGKSTSSDVRIRVQISDAKRCAYYSCVVLEGLTDRASPKFMQDRLMACGLRPINLVVDVTNYVLLELGQPLHAFDLDKLGGGKIIVRAAREGERLTAINGTEYALSGRDLVIADGEKPVALAGVMGGKFTEVGPGTTRILLESAAFDPAAVRFTSRRFALQSDSSYRFERGVDPKSVDEARMRAVHLLQKYGSVSAVSPVFKAGKLLSRQKTIRFDPELVNNVLGTNITQTVSKRILTDLALPVRVRNKYTWEVAVPSARPDLTRPIDLVEEVARIYGYDRIPETLPAGAVSFGAPHPTRAVEEKVKDILVGAGYFEAVTFSLENADTLKRLGFLPDHATTIVNPQNKELTIMRPSLIPGLLRAHRVNIDAGHRDIRLFELASVYGPEEGRRLPTEEVHVACLLAGRRDESWQSAKNEVDFYDMKGLAELFLFRQGIKTFEFRPYEHPVLKTGEAERLYVNTEQIGFLGMVSGQAAETFGIKQKAWVLEINITRLAAHAHRIIRYVMPDRYPSAKRDIALVIKAQTSANAIMESIRRAGGSLIRRVELFDVFQGGSIPKGQRSLAYSIEYGSDDRTLTSEEVNQTHEKIASALKADHQAQIR